MPIDIQKIQLQGDTKILRFLNKDGLINTLDIGSDTHVHGLHPTLLLRSLQYYKTVEDHRRDSYENEVHTEQNDIKFTSRNGNHILASCWSLYQENQLYSNETWDFFPDALAAIECTVDGISTLLQTSKTNNDLLADFVSHGEIQYYENDLNINTVRPYESFFKRKHYKAEKEYRSTMIFGPNKNFFPDVHIIPIQTNLITKIYLNSQRMSALSETEEKLIHTLYPNQVQKILLP